MWSLGISLIELALGRFPFADDSSDNSDLSDFEGTLSPSRPGPLSALPSSKQREAKERMSVPVHKNNPVPLPASIFLLELEVKDGIARLVRGELREEIVVEVVVGFGRVLRDLLGDDDGLVVRAERVDDVFVLTLELEVVKRLDAVFGGLYA